MELAAKIKAAPFDPPKKEAGNATTATTNAYGTKQNWREKK
jgi:hypothetical protein